MKSDFSLILKVFWPIFCFKENTDHEITLLSLYLSHTFQILNQLTDFHEIWYNMPLEITPIS
jgi:hypothetical protein